MSDRDDFWKELMGEDAGSGAENAPPEKDVPAQPGGFTIEYVNKDGETISPPPAPAQSAAPARPARQTPAPAQSAAPVRPAQQTPAPAQSAAPVRPAQQTPAPTQSAAPVRPAQQTPAPTQSAAPVRPAQQAPAPTQSAAPVRSGKKAGELPESAVGPKDFEVDFDFDKEYEDVHEKPVRRGRTKRTGCLSGFMYFLFVISLSLVLACLCWMAATDVLGLGDANEVVEVTIPKDIFSDKVVTVSSSSGSGSSGAKSAASSSGSGAASAAASSSKASSSKTSSSKASSASASGETKVVSAADMNQVAELLYEKGLIKYRWLFKLYSRFSKADEKVKAGTYQLNKDYDYRALVNGMTESGGTRVTVDVTIPEGYTITQIVALLVKNGVCDEDELKDALANYDFDYAFLDSSTLGDPKRLEGYLFPDTYTFYVGDTPTRVIGKLLSNFKAKWTDAFQAKADALGYTQAQVITIASIIEREAGVNSERATIASVIYNRLENPDARTAGYLQIDATIYYAIEDTGEAFSTDVVSPYNTYLHQGLTPGPISNPGLASIKAALNPEKTDYYYYALGKDKVHHFYKTYDSFEEFLNSSDYAGNAAS